MPRKTNTAEGRAEDETVPSSAARLWDDLLGRSSHVAHGPWAQGGRSLSYLVAVFEPLAAAWRWASS